MLKDEEYVPGEVTLGSFSHECELEARDTRAAPSIEARLPVNTIKAEIRFLLVPSSAQAFQATASKNHKNTPKNSPQSPSGNFPLLQCHFIHVSVSRALFETKVTIRKEIPTACRLHGSYDRIILLQSCEMKVANYFSCATNPRAIILKLGGLIRCI